MTAASSPDQADTLRRGSFAAAGRSLPTRLRCLSIASGKGGVGKTFVATGLACALAQKGFRVLLCDADLGLANADIQMGVDPRYTVQDVVFGRTTLAEAVVHTPYGPDLLASASGAVDMVEMGNARRQMFAEELLRFSVGYDFLILDVAAGIGSNITTFLLASPEVLVVVANEPTSIMDAYSLIKLLNRHPSPPAMQILVNLARSIGEGERLARRLAGITQRFLGISLPLVGLIVQDPVVGDAIRARIPVSVFAPRSPASQCLADVARAVAEGRMSRRVTVENLDNLFHQWARYDPRAAERRA